MTSKKKHYLTKKQFTELKALLQERLDEIGGHNQEVRSNINASEFESKADELDKANDEADHMLQMRIHDREQKLVNKLRKILSRIDDDEEYGYCVSCGAPIGFERLKARPVAELCIECKKEFEARERRERDMSRLTGIS